MASRCDEQEAADDLRKPEAARSESVDVLIAVVKDLQTKSLWIFVAVAGKVRAHPCPQLFPLAIAALGPTCACAATRTATDTSRSQASSKSLPCCLRQRCFPYIPYMYVVSTYIYIYIYILHA